MAKRRVLSFATFSIVATIVAGCGGDSVGGEDTPPASGGTGGEVTATGGDGTGASVSTGGAATGGAGVGGTTGGADTGGASVGGTATGGIRTGGASGGGTGGERSGGAGGADPVGGTGGAAGEGSGGDRSGGAGGRLDPAGEVAKFVEEFVTPFCSRLVECCGEAGYAVDEPTFASACQEEELMFAQGHLEDGTAFVVSELTEAFRDSISSSCDQPAYSTMLVTRGTLPEGADCEDAGQCEGENVMCDVTDGSDVGVCRRLLRGQAGDPCMSTCVGSSCRFTLYHQGTDSEAIACWDEDGLYCNSETDECTPVTPVGQPCEGFQECGETGECYDGQCVAQAGLGEDCSGNGRYCQSTMLCDSDTLTCVKMSIAWSGSCEIN